MRVIIEEVNIMFHPSFVNRDLYLIRLNSYTVPFCSIMLMSSLIELLKRHSRFVSEAYLHNVSLDEDQMPHDLKRETVSNLRILIRYS